MNTFSIVARQSLALAWPIVLSRVLYTLGIFTSMVLLARLGHTALAAGVLISTANIVINVSLNAVLFGLSALTSRLHGEARLTDIGHMARSGMVIALLLSVTATLILLHIGQILIAFHQPVTISRAVQEYFNGYLWSLPSYYLAMVISQITSGVKRPRFSLFTSSSWLIFCSVLAYGFGFGAFGLPHWGIYGVGFGYGIGGWITFINALILMRIIPYYRQFNFFTWRTKLQHIKHIVIMGSHIAIQLSGELLAMGFAALMVGWLGSQALAAYQIAYQFSLLLLIPLFALGQVAGIQISHAIGEKSFHTLRMILPANLIIGGLYYLLAAIIVITLPSLIISLFLPGHAATPQITHTAKWLLYLCLISSLADGVRNIITGGLRGYFDTRFAMILGLICIWGISIPTAALCAFTLNFGVYGITTGFILGITICAIIINVRYRFIKQKIFENNTI